MQRLVTDHSAGTLDKGNSPATIYDNFDDSLEPVYQESSIENSKDELVEKPWLRSHRSAIDHELFGEIKRAAPT